MTGLVSPSASGAFSLTNRATIATADLDWDERNNAAVVTSTVDGRMLQVVATSPVSGATGVGLMAPLVIAFNEPVQVLTVTVTPATGGWATVWSGDGTVVTQTHSAFSIGTTYTVSVDHAVGQSGRVLCDAPYVWTFETVAYRAYLPVVNKE